MTNILQRIHQRFDELFKQKFSGFRLEEIRAARDGRVLRPEYDDIDVRKFVKQFVDQAIIEALTEVVPKIIGEREVEDSMNNSFKDGYWARGSEAKARFKELVEELKDDR